MKDKTMRKATFVKGAFVATLSIVVTKLLGIFYVIPFHALIGDKGGALYGYAYTIYLLFMGLSTAGIPLSISKIVSEYQTLGYYNAKRRAFIIGKRIALLLGLVVFLILVLFAPIIAQTILGNLKGGNSLSDVVFVIRIIATAILVVPVLSIYRGYFEGHRFMNPPAISQVIEQLFRILVIILGSYLAIKVFKLKLTSAVGIAVFGATVGALVAYLYLVNKQLNNKNKFNEKIRDVNEPKIDDKVILKKIIIYAVPFIMIDVFKSLYSYIDMVTVVKDLVLYAGFSTNKAEIVMSIFSTWGAKFNMIVLSISAGVIVSLIPNLTKSYVTKDKEDINNKINQALAIVIYLTLPITVLISFLAKPVWLLFYGNSIYGPNILAFYIFVGLFTALFTTSVSIVQVLKEYKTVFISLFVGVLLKFLLNTQLIIAFRKMGLMPYYGAISATIIGYLVGFIICLVKLKSKYKVNYEDLVRNFIDTLSGSVIMLFILYLISLIIPLSFKTRILNIFSLLFYGVVGLIIYFVYTVKMKTVNNIFGDKLNKYLKKLPF